MNKTSQTKPTTAQKTHSEIYLVQHADLPLHCPTEDMPLWSTHPRVYLPIEETGKAICPYCGTTFQLKE